MTERQILLRELKQSYKECNDDSDEYDEENDMEGFELKMLEYELFGIEN